MRVNLWEKKAKQCIFISDGNELSSVCSSIVKQTTLVSYMYLVSHRKTLPAKTKLTNAYFEVVNNNKKSKKKPQ